MRIFIQHPDTSFFNEEDFIRTLFFCRRIAEDHQSLAKRIMRSIPGDNYTRFFPQSYYLDPISFAHILERHYLRPLPDTSRFTIPIPTIVRFIRNGFLLPTELINPTNFKRGYHAGTIVGFNQHGNPTDYLTIITNPSGKIKTAYPGS